jgi:hypothetical protein
MLLSNLMKQVIMHREVKLRNDERFGGSAGMIQETCHYGNHRQNGLMGLKNTGYVAFCSEA